MSNADTAAYMSSEQARMDGVRLLAQLLKVPQIEVARRAFDRLLYAHRDLLLAHVEEHYAERSEDLRELLGRSLEDIVAAESPLELAEAS